MQIHGPDAVYLFRTESISGPVAAAATMARLPRRGSAAHCGSVIDAVLTMSRPPAVAPQTAAPPRRTRTPGDERPDDEELSVAEVKLSAEPRSEFGKGAARRLRRANKVPAVLYGHGTDPVHVTLPGHETMLALKHSNTLLSVDLDGTSQLALPKDVQRHAIKGFIEHVDLLLVRRGEKVTVDIPVQVVGTPVSGTIVTQENTTLSVEVEATNIPQSLEVSVDGAGDGTRITATDVTLPAGATLATDPDAVVVAVSVPAAEASEAEAATGEAAEGGEGEVAEAASAEG